MDFSKMNTPHSWLYADIFVLIQEGCNMFGVITVCLNNLSRWLAGYSGSHSWSIETK